MILIKHCSGDEMKGEVGWLVVCMGEKTDVYRVLVG